MAIGLIILALIVGIILAFPLAIAICAALGGLSLAYGRLTIRCPGCDACRMRWMGGIRTSYPANRGTGRSYLCEDCGHRWFWSYNDRAWKDADGPSFDHMFN